MTGQTPPEGKADRLIDMLVEETLAMSDEEILADAGDDMDAVDRALQAEIDAALAAHRRQRLEEARAAVAASRTIPRLVRPRSADLRGAISKAIANNDAAFTLAARDGRDLPDDDVAGIAEDLRDLGFDLDEEDNS